MYGNICIYILIRNERKKQPQKKNCFRVTEESGVNSNKRETNSENLFLKLSTEQTNAWIKTL